MFKGVNKWKKEYPNMLIYTNAPRRKTFKMDSKISFGKIMGQSDYTPDTYFSYSDIPENTNEDMIFYVKTDGGTGAKGVSAYNYRDLSNVNCKNSVIQSDFTNPDLYDNKRYKLRVHVIIYNKNVYYHKDNRTTISNINYSSQDNNKKEKHVINQTNNYILSNTLLNFNEIENNILKSLSDFKKYYINEINNIGENEYAILGFDYVVNKEKNVKIIEINHRSNYSYPDNISNITDVICIKDIIKLLVNQSHENTNLIKI